MCAEAQVPRKLGKYKIIRQIGAGAMGRLFEAEDELLLRRAALKILAPQYSANPEYVERFRREALAAARVFSPNVAQIYQVSGQNGLHYIAMEFVDGVGLEEYIIKNDLRLKEILELFMQVSLAIQEAHVNKVYHRDIKGENIKVTPQGHSKILDFGIAKIESMELSDLTRSGVVVGTARYISPEQSRGEKIDGRTDIFALGVLLYEVLSGDLPWPLKATATQTIIARGHETDPPAPMQRTRYQVPEELEIVIRKMIAFDRNDRQATMLQVHKDLKQIHRRLEVAEARYALGPVEQQEEKPAPEKPEVNVKEILVNFGIPLLAALGILIFL